MKMFLFLDDSEERHLHFNKITAIDNVTVIHCKTANEAIDALDKIKFDCVFLDHDLEDTDPNSTGQTVAEFIALHMNPAMTPKNIIIHSWNPEGAEIMEMTLNSAGIKNVKKIEFSLGE
jgi:hypothetical protein